MFPLIVGSILIRCVALTWSIKVWFRLRDHRIIWLSAVLVCLIARQTLTLIGHLGDGGDVRTSLLAEMFATGTSLLCLGAVYGLSRMIEDRDSTAAALRRSEETQRALINAMPDAMFLMNREGVYLSYKTPDESRLIIPPATFLNRKVSDVLPPEMAGQCRRAIEAALNTGRPQSYEYDYARGGMTRRWEARVAVCGRDEVLVLVRDITDLRRMEQALQRSTEDLERAQAVAHTGSWVSDVEPSGRLTWSAETSRIFGFAPGEFDEKVETFFRHVHPDDAAKVRAAADRSFATGEPYDLEHRIIRRDGQVRWVRERADVVCDPHGRALRMIGVVQEITDRKRTEEALLASESRYRRLTEHGALGVWEVDAEGRTIYANPRMCAMLEVNSQDDLRGLDFRTFFSPASLVVFATELERRRAGHASTYELEIIGARGGRRSVLVSGAPMMDASAALSSLIATFADITEHKLAQQRLRDAEQRNALLIRQTPLGVILIDPDTRILEWNPSAEKIFGYTAREAVGRSFNDLIIPESARAHVARIWEDLRTNAGGARSTNENLTKSGNIILCEWYNSPLVDADSRVFAVACMVQDVTEVHRLERELRQSQKMEAIGRLASGVAHDFSSLLTAISGFTSLARRTLSPQHPAVRSLDRVDEAATQAVGVTKALLTFSRRGTTEKGPVDLGQIIQDAARLLRRTLPANIELRTRDEGEPLWVHADTTQLHQVVMNLAINARDAMRKGGVITLSAHAPDADHAAVSVRDEGEGMTPDIQTRIFEPFFTTKPPGEGTGLGLAISHAIVKDHGGAFTVVSEPGRGSTFTFTLPSGPAPAATPPNGTPAVSAGKGESLLLFSTHAFTREIMSSSLKSFGYRVLQVSDPTLLHELAADPAARLLIIDTDTLPEPRSESLERARAAAHPLKILILGSMLNSQGPSPDTNDLVLPKPFQIHELAAAVSEALT
jgi:two-component system, cell cycle sensor histidine kinase and response regulator CckA